MSYQDVRHHYEDREDEPEPTPVALEAFQCWWCHERYVLRADDEGRRFCSNECDLKWCDWSRLQEPPTPTTTGD